MAVKASVTITISKYRDTDSITRYYKLQASTAAAPAVPTTLTPSGWSTSEPTYTSGSTNTLYYTDCIVFSDGTFQYTDDGSGKAVKSSSYEAAKQAYNKAQAAQDAADATQENLDNLEIGGRNYLYNTAFLKNDKSKYQIRGNISLNIVNDGYNNHKALQAIFNVAGSSGININMLLTSSSDGYCDINTDYIFSGWAKALENTKLHARFGYGTTNNTFNIGTEWTKFEIPVRSGSQGWYFAPYIDTATTIYFSDIKLEKGSKASDWTPAPEDDIEAIDNAQTTADNITNRVNDKENHYNFKYYLDVRVYGDTNKFYPVIIKYGNQDTKRTIMVKRGYSELAPAEWNKSTHPGALTLKILCNFGDWGGANYSWEIHELEEMYSQIFGGAVNCGNNCMFAIYLRGGGENGAIYHFYSDMKLDQKGAYDYGWDEEQQLYVINKLPSPQISYRTNYIQYKSDLCFGCPGNKTPVSTGKYEDLQYKTDAPAPRDMVANGTTDGGFTRYVRTSAQNEEIRIRRFIKLSQDNDPILKSSIKSITNLYYASNSSTPPAKPTAHVTTNSALNKAQWNIALPTYDENYPYLYTCKEVLLNNGTYSWTTVNQTTYAEAIKTMQTELNAVQADYLKETTFTTYKREQIENDQGIKQRLSRTEVTVYGDPNNPDDPEALINHIQKVDNDINGSGGLDDRLEAAEDTIDGTGLNDYDQRVKITQRFLNVETDVESIKNIFKITGGTNLIQNSVGYFADNDNKPTMWSISANTIYIPFGYDGDLTGITVSRGRLFCAKGSVATTPNNIVALLANKMMSISFKYKNGANATSKIKVFNGSVVYFEKTFNSAVNQWTEYTFNPDTDPVLANPSFLNTANSLQISIESTNSTNNNGFEISDLMLNYGDIKPWELSSNEVYGAMVKLSSLGIEVTATTAKTKNFMTTDGILVYQYDPQTDTISNLITKITDNGTVTNRLESTGDIVERDLIHTMIKDSSNNNVYVEYIR